MGILCDTLLQAEIRGDVVSDYVGFIDGQVALKKGPSGLLIKTAYKSLKGVKPGYMQEVVEVLLPSFMEVLDTHHVDYQESGDAAPFEDWIDGRASLVADKLIGITDEVVQLSDKKMVQKVYKGIRKIAHKNVVPTVPGMAQVAMKYMT